MFRKTENTTGAKLDENSYIENSIDELMQSATNPYAVSIPLIASAQLKDETRYQSAREKMLYALSNLDIHPNQFPEWMRNNSFKAWMLGRLLLAANHIDDKAIVLQTKKKLALLLKSDITTKDNIAFLAWAWGYLAALDETEYKIATNTMMISADVLSAKYKLSQSHDDLSNALWAWVMNIAASANVKDEKTYNTIKEAIKSLTGANTITESIEKGLLRTATSNDYPAWALAKIYAAAAMIGDEELSKEIDATLSISIQNAKINNQQAEYILAALDKQIAARVMEAAPMNTRPISI